MNAEGDFYVETGVCMFCDAPRSEAPDLIEYAEESCYFKRQPATEGELKQAINACSVSCVEALRYAGSNPRVLSDLQKSLCDIFE